MPILFARHSVEAFLSSDLISIKALSPTQKPVVSGNRFFCANTFTANKINKYVIILLIIIVPTQLLF